MPPFRLGAVAFGIVAPGVASEKRDLPDQGAGDRFPELYIIRYELEAKSVIRLIVRWRLHAWFSCIQRFGNFGAV